jgi:hypothetical protein
MPTSPRKGPDGGIGGRNHGTKTHKDDHAFFLTLENWFHPLQPLLELR